MHIFFLDISIKCDKKGNPVLVLERIGNKESFFYARMFLVFSINISLLNIYSIHLQCIVRIAKASRYCCTENLDTFHPTAIATMLAPQLLYMYFHIPSLA